MLCFLLISFLFLLTPIQPLLESDEAEGDGYPHEDVAEGDAELAEDPLDEHDDDANLNELNDDVEQNFYP